MQAASRKYFSRVVLLVATFVLLQFSATAQAEDDFFEVDLLDLRFSTDDEQLPEEILDRLQNSRDYEWVGAGSLRAEIGGGEAYLTPMTHARRFQDDRIDENVRLVVRAPAGRNVVHGTVYLPEPCHFALPDTAQPSDVARETFYRAKENYYTRLLDLRVAGGAWFRRQAQEAREARLGENAGSVDRGARLWRGQDGFDASYALFSGGRALSENFQLDRLLEEVEPAPETVAIAEIPGITIAEIDWEPLLAEAEPPLDPLARYVPHDQHAVFIPSFAALAQMIDEAQAYGTPVLRSIEPASEDARTLERYQRQLCLTLDFLSRQAGGQVVSSIALTGSDPYYRTGTDVAVIFETEGNGLEILAAFIATRHALAVENDRAEEVKGELLGYDYTGAVSHNRAICSYACRLENALVVTNSLAQLKQVLLTATGETASLASLDEYKFFRQRYSRSDSAETAFLMISDATIRRWCGPRWRIASSRRTRAMAILAELQARHVDELAVGFGERQGVELHYNMSDMGDLTIDNGGADSSIYGTLTFQTPIRELECELATVNEESAYTRFRQAYERRWRGFFDPIGVQVTLGHNELAADMTVMPLIADSEYRAIEALGPGVLLDPQAGDLHAGSGLQWVLAVSPRGLRQEGGFAQFDPNQAESMNWVGDSFTIYVEKSPFWEGLAACEDEDAAEVYILQNLSDIPIALRLEVTDSERASEYIETFWNSLRNFSNERFERETLTYRGREYEKVTIFNIRWLNVEEWTFYSTVGPDALVLAFTEEMLTESIDRELDGGPAGEAEAAPPEQLAWLGESMALRVEGDFLRLIHTSMHHYYLQRMQQRCYANLPILNEWHRRYPDRDPVEMHEHLFHTRLVCPGGGEYVWNEPLQTMESTVYGSPADRRDGPLLSELLSQVELAEFGVTFENDGLRARLRVERVEE